MLSGFLLQRNIPQSAIDALVQGGCMSLNDLQFLDEEMLNAMHIYKPFERKKLLMLSNEVISPSARLDEVSLVLCNAGILRENAQKYGVMLAKQGFDSPEKLAEVTEEDLAVCGITSRFDCRLILTLQSKLASPSPAVRRQSLQPMMMTTTTPVDNGQAAAAALQQLRLEEAARQRAREEKDEELIRLQQEQEELIRLQQEQEELIRIQQKQQRAEELRMQLEEEARVCAELERMRLEREEQDRLEREEMERRRRPQRQDGTCSYLTNQDIADLLDEIALHDEAISAAFAAGECSIATLVQHFKQVVREHLPSATPPKMLVEYSHLRVIYRWIAQNIAFDFDSTTTREDCNAEQVLLARKANCYGYSALLQAMATEIGLEMRICHGYIKHETFQVGDELSHEHCWNLVILGAKRRPFLLDVTLSAGTTSGGELFARKWQPHYFLCPSNLFILDHLPFDPQNQLLVHQFSSEQVSNFPICRSDFFASKMQLVSHFEHGTVECSAEESNVEMEFRLDAKWRIKIPVLREIGSGEICENCPQSVLRRRKDDEDQEDKHMYTATVFPPKMRGDYDLTIYVAHADNVNAASWAVSYLFRVI